MDDALENTVSGQWTVRATWGIAVVFPLTIWGIAVVLFLIALGIIEQGL